LQDNRPKMDAFLASVEKRAFYMARMATGNREDALDIVQEAMFSWVRYYQTKPETLWKALFYRVLNSRINDWYRRRRVRHRVRRWFGGRTTEAGDTGEDPIERLPDTGSPPPVEQVMVGAATETLAKALKALPLRQRQAFLLRAWEGMSVKATAAAMQCSQGSVKTHYSRALQALRHQLEGYWP